MKSIFDRFYRSNTIRLLLGVLALVEAYNFLVLPGVIQSYQGREATAIARNAEMKREADAAIAEAEAITRGEVARWADLREAALARRTAAHARKTEADARTASAEANYANLMKKAEADVASAQVAINKEAAENKLQEATYASKRLHFENYSAKVEALVTEISNRIGDPDPRRRWRIFCGDIFCMARDAKRGY